MIWTSYRGFFGTFLWGQLLDFARGFFLKFQDELRFHPFLLQTNMFVRPKSLRFYFQNYHTFQTHRNINPMVPLKRYYHASIYFFLTPIKSKIIYQSMLKDRIPYHLILSNIPCRHHRFFQRSHPKVTMLGRRATPCLDKFWGVRISTTNPSKKLLAHKFGNLSNSWKWTQISCQGHFKRHSPSLNHQVSSWWILRNMAGQKFSRASFFGAATCPIVLNQGMRWDPIYTYHFAGTVQGYIYGW